LNFFLAFKYFCSQHKLALFALNDFLSEDLLFAACQLFLAKLSKAMEQSFFAICGGPQEAKQELRLDLNKSHFPYSSLISSFG